VQQSFWYPNSSKLYTLNDDGVLVQFGGTDSQKFLFKSVGDVLDIAKLKKLSIDYIRDNTESNEKTCIEKGGKLALKIRERAYSCVLDFIKYRNQRTSISMRVDMFTTTASVNLLEDAAEVVYAHAPFKSGEYSETIVADYKAHFPELNEVLKQIVASRFACDRKQSYLWHKADSDWGKGFLYDGILKDLGCVVGLSVKEVEGIFEGKPVGRTMFDFKRCLVLFFDEFKTVKSELKQLQNSITISPKNQLSVEVSIYSKIFVSAEGVDSLVTSAGIEDQFANRFSFIESRGDIKQTPEYLKTSKAAYYRSVKNYVATFLNNEIERLIALGPDKAVDESDSYLVEFHTKHSIDKGVERLSAALPRVAEDFKRWVDKKYISYNNSLCTFSPSTVYGDDKVIGELVVKDEGFYYVKSPSKVIDMFINATIDDSSKVSLKRKKTELLLLISSSGSGARSYRLNKYEVFKAVQMMVVDCNRELRVVGGSDDF